jgi:hypothetical protein
LPILDIPYTWIHVMCDFLHLAAFNYHYIFKLYLWCVIYQQFTHFYNWIVIHGMYNTVYILLVCLSINGLRMGCFHFLLLVIYRYEYFCQGFGWRVFFLPLGYTRRGRTDGSYSNSMFNVLRNCQTIFQSGYAIYVPTGVSKDSNFAANFANICQCLSLIINIFVDRKW